MKAYKIKLNGEVITLKEILLEKHSYNKTRPYKHGGKKI